MSDSDDIRKNPSRNAGRHVLGSSTVAASFSNTRRNHVHVPRKFTEQCSAVKLVTCSRETIVNLTLILRFDVIRFGARDHFVRSSKNTVLITHKTTQG